MVIESNFGCNVEQFDIGVLEHFIADLGVGFHYLPFTVIQFARLVKNFVRDGNFTKIMQRCGLAQQVYLLLRNTRQSCQQFAVFTYPFNMNSGFLGSGFHDFADPVHDFTLIAVEQIVEIHVAVMVGQCFLEQFCQIPVVAVTGRIIKSELKYDAVKVRIGQSGDVVSIKQTFPFPGG